MRPPSAQRWILRAAAVAALLTLCAASGASSALAAMTPVSSDPFTNPTSQHATAVEPDSYAFGHTVVEASQLGRFFDGGASGIGWARSGNDGATWVSGSLPGITQFGSVPGPYDRVSDPSVAFDRKHGVWMVSSLALSETPAVHATAVLVSRSTNGGTSWGTPVVVLNDAGGQDPDKNWTVCDNTATSPFYGSCYTEWDDSGRGGLIQMSVSRDGGLTWSAPAATANLAHGIAGQPLVRSGGAVIVPILNAFESRLLWFRSRDGGATWSSTRLVTPLSVHQVAGPLRAPPLPSAEIDRSGRIFVVWADCRFRASCASNDIVMATLTGTTWSPVVRIPLDGVQSGQDHFLPSIAVDRTSSGATARVTVSYYHYPVAGCGFATCKLDVAVTSSADGGATWAAPVFLAGPMSLSWVPDTTQGRMVGDYFSTSYVGGHAQTFLSIAKDPLGSGTEFNQVLSTAALAAPVRLSALRPVDARVAGDAGLSSAHHPITAR